MKEFLEQNTYYIVMLISIIIWIGIGIYLFILDKKITNLEELIKRNYNEDTK